MKTHYNNRPIPFESQRVPIDQKVLIRSPHFKGFMSEYASNISITGMFIRSEKPVEVGTVFACEFRLAEDLVLIQGDCQVVWVRTKAEGQDLPSGMGVRFLKLDPQSRRLIRWTVERHIMEGGTPFELEAAGPSSSAQVDTPEYVKEEGNETVYAEAVAAPPSTREAAGGPVPPASYARVGVAKSGERKSNRWLPVAAGLVLAVLAVGFFWSRLGSGGSTSGSSVPATAASGSEGTDRSRSEPPSDSAVAAQATPQSTTRSNENFGAGTAAGNEPATDAASTVASMEAPQDPPPAPAPVRDISAEVEEAVRAWASAWASQNVDAYLASYSLSFVPTSGSRTQWSRQRRQRITAPRSIDVEISNLVAEELGADRARARFSQVYRSDSFQDQTRKIMDLVYEEGRWRIQSERAE